MSALGDSAFFEVGLEAAGFAESNFFAAPISVTYRNKKIIANIPNVLLINVFYMKTFRNSSSTFPLTLDEPVPDKSAPDDEEADTIALGLL